MFQSTPPHGGRLLRPFGSLVDRSVVSIHAPARGRPLSLSPSIHRQCLFQSTPPHGGRPVCERLNQRQYCVVSIHAPARGATKISARSDGLWSFQSTPPHGGRQCVVKWALDARQRFQSTPRTGGDAAGWCAVQHVVVSIHAPARGATPDCVPQRQPAAGVSIHAPARGATRSAGCRAATGGACFNPRPRTGGDSFSRLPSSHRRCLFQSTPPHGGDTRGRITHQRLLIVSIHAPHGGRPAGRSRARRWWRLFQSTPRTGGDTPVPAATPPEPVGVSIHAPARGATALMGGILSPQLFQSTPPHGGRPFDVPNATILHPFNPRPRTGGDNPIVSAVQPGGIGFNPRPRTGGDADRIRASDRVVVSIHAPARGATSWSGSPALPGAASFNPRPRTGGDSRVTLKPVWLGVFQSTPPHGGRPVYRSIPRIRLPMGEFQSTPPHGGRHLVNDARERMTEFQSTPPHGGRPEGGCCARDLVAVSIHAPARGATPRARQAERDGRRPDRFNPRPRTGGDCRGGCHYVTACDDVDVSIHAPARGATVDGARHRR